MLAGAGAGAITLLLAVVVAELVRPVLVIMLLLCQQLDWPTQVEEVGVAVEIVLQQGPLVVLAAVA
jgi:hypothetical protein